MTDETRQSAIENALQPLRLPGWENVEQTVRQLLTEELERQAHGDGSLPTLVVTGGPGTGKTMIGYRLGAVLREAGVLQRGHVVRDTPEELMGTFVGAAASITRSKIIAARDGVLFLDDASHTVLETLEQALADTSHPFCLVLAGYPEGVQALFAANPGLRERCFHRVVGMEDFSPDVLTAILREKLAETKAPLSAELAEPVVVSGVSYDPLKCLVERLWEARDPKTFANASLMTELAWKVSFNYGGKGITWECFAVALDGVAKITKDWFLPRTAGAPEQPV